MYPQMMPEAASSGQGMIHKITTRHLKILVVDDDSDFRESMGFLLSKKYEAQVKEVGSGPKAIEAVKADPEFDLVFLDLTMPGMNGLETLQQLRDLHFSRRVVLMSAHSDTSEWDEAKRLNVELVSKPYPGSTITEILYQAANA